MTPVKNEEKVPVVLLQRLRQAVKKVLIKYPGYRNGVKIGLEQSSKICRMIRPSRSGQVLRRFANASMVARLGSDDLPGNKICCVTMKL